MPVRASANTVKGKRPTGKDQGSAAVEFALVLPVLVLVIFGIVDLGRLLNARMTLDQAAHEGARAAAIGVDATDVRARIDQALGSMAGATTVAPISPCDGSDGDVTITLTHQFAYVFPLFGGPSELTSTAVVPCLR